MLQALELLLGLPSCCHSPAIIACLQSFIIEQACIQSPENIASIPCCAIEGMALSLLQVLLKAVSKGHTILSGRSCWTRRLRGICAFRDTSQHRNVRSSLNGQVRAPVSEAFRDV